MTTNRLLKYGDALLEAQRQEMERDESVFVFGLDVDDHKAILGSTVGLQDRFGPERVFSTALSEDAMTGFAVGAAIAGMRPIHVHIRMDFLMLCMNQLVNMAAKARYMWGGQVQVPMVVRGMIGKSWGQGPQHSQSLYPMFMHVPGLKVVAPSNAHDAKGCLIASIRDNNPVVFIEHRMLYYTEAYVPEESYEVPLGKGRIVAKGDDITIVGVSHMVLDCLRARELLGESGIGVEVIDPISLIPLDMDTILRSARRTGRLLIVENGWTTCGASAEIMARVAESAPGERIAMQRMGFAPTTCPTSPTLERAFYPNPVTIAEKAYAMCLPNGPTWRLSEEQAVMAHELQFKGPF